MLARAIERERAAGPNACHCCRRLAAQILRPVCAESGRPGPRRLNRLPADPGHCPVRRISCFVGLFVWQFYRWFMCLELWVE